MVPNPILLELKAKEKSTQILGFDIKTILNMPRALRSTSNFKIFSIINIVSFRYVPELEFGNFTDESPLYVSSVSMRDVFLPQWGELFPPYFPPYFGKNVINGWSYPETKISRNENILR